MIYNYWDLSETKLSENELDKFFQMAKKKDSISSIIEKNFFEFTFVTEITSLETERVISPLKVTHEKLNEGDATTFYLNGDGLCLGKITLSFEDEDHVYIKYMTAFENKKYYHIGTALHELAIRCSFQYLKKDFQGSVRLRADKGADEFHFRNGFEYDHDPIDLILPRKYDTLIDLHTEYMKAKNRQEDVTPILEKIASDRDYPKLEELAGKQLFKKPVTVEEAIKFGVYRNRNEFLRRLYFENGVRCKILSLSRPRFTVGGAMTLSDEARSLWKKIIFSSTKL